MCTCYGGGTFPFQTFCEGWWSEQFEGNVDIIWTLQKFFWVLMITWLSHHPARFRMVRLMMILVTVILVTESWMSLGSWTAQWMHLKLFGMTFDFNWRVLTQRCLKWHLGVVMQPEQSHSTLVSPLCQWKGTCTCPTPWNDTWPRWIPMATIWKTTWRNVDDYIFIISLFLLLQGTITCKQCGPR